MKKRQVLIISLAVLLSVCLFAAEAFAAETIVSEPVYSGSCGDSVSWEYDKDSGVFTVSGTGEMSDFKTTKKISWYEYRSDIVKIVIEEGVTSVGKNAFNGCGNAEIIKLPDSLTRIGQSAFAGCHSVLELEIPASLQSVGEGAFTQCYGLLTVNIKDILGWCRIDFGDEESNPALNASEVLVNRGNLVTLSIPDGVENIDYKLIGFKNLVSVKIPASVKTVGNYAFYNCRSIVNIELAQGIESIGDSAFCGCVSVTSIRIPDSVKSIGEDAFRGCLAMERVSIGSGVVTIGATAFQGCEKITEVALPDSLIAIGEGAFNACTSLKKVSLGSNLAIIGKAAFSYCTSLASAVLPEKLVEIPSEMFVGCEELNSVTLPGRVTAIGASAFENCGKLEEIVIPDSVVSIGANAFSGCANLTNVYFGSKPVKTDDKNKSEEVSGVCMLSQIGSGAFGGTGVVSYTDMDGATVTQKRINIYISDLRAWCYTAFADAEANPMNNPGVEAENYNLKVYINGTSLDALTIPADIQMISPYAFVDAKCITSLSLTDSIVGIGLNAFSGCTHLHSVKYTGTDEQWEKIDISKGNEAIAKLTSKSSISTSVKLTSGSTSSGSATKGKFNVTFKVENLFICRKVIVIAVCCDSAGRFVSQSSIVIEGGKNSSETYKIPVDNRSGNIASYKLTFVKY